MATWHWARRLAPRPLAEKCGALLAEWVDATAEEMHDRIDSMSEVPAAGQADSDGSWVTLLPNSVC